MRTCFAIFSAITILSLFPASFTGQSLAGVSAAQERIAKDNFIKLPLHFELNRGQTDPKVRFLSRGNGYTLFLTDKDAIMKLSADRSGIQHMGSAYDAPHTATSGKNPEEQEPLRMRLVGARSSVRISGAELLPGTASYFIGNDTTKWRSGIPTYAKVKYAGVYPGVDLIYYGNQQQLEYDFIVAPGADPNLIQLKFSGAKKIDLNANGDLSVAAQCQSVALQKPVVYQIVDGKRQLIKAKFSLLRNNSIGFELGRYDHSRQLIIDPVLIFSTFLGGSNGGNFGEDYVSGIAVDGSGYVYVTGEADSANFPVTQGSYQSMNDSGLNIAYIAKLNPTGTQLVYSTYIGGPNAGNFGAAIAIDGSGDAYITGETSSAGFPTTYGAFQTTISGGASGTAFVTALDASGSTLLYSTLLGGSNGATKATAIALDGSGNAYVTGSTASSSFPVTVGAFQTEDGLPTNEGQVAFVSKVNAMGTVLLYSTYLAGTTGGSSAAGIAVDSSGEAYVTGTTSATDFPVTANAFQTVMNANPLTGGKNAFVTALNSSGSGLIYSTYLGGSVLDEAQAIALDGSDNAYVAGLAISNDFPTTTGAFQTTKMNQAAFVAKISSTGSALLYSTFLGGLGSFPEDSAFGIAIDALGDAYVTGTAKSTKFPTTPGALMPSFPGQTSAFLTKLNNGGSSLLYSTYFGGGQGTTSSAAIALNPSSGNLYIAGQTFASDLPVTSGAFQTVNNGAAAGDANGFVAGFPIGGQTTATLLSSNNPQTQGISVTFTATVTSSFSGGAPTGTIAFSVNGVTIQTVALSGTGNASFTTSSLAVGSHTIQAQYSGDPNFLPSSASLTETIVAAVAPATMVSPTPGSTLSGTAPTTFTWTTGVGVSSYELALGTQGPGSNDVYDSNTTGSTSATVSNLPANGATVYATLYSLITGVLEQIDYTYTEASPFTAMSEAILYNFINGATGDGYSPAGGLIMDQQGNIYGTTVYGGQNDAGTVFKLTPSGAETILHSFAADGVDGYYPNGSLAIDAQGNLYGTTRLGGTGHIGLEQVGVGTVFKIAPDGAETVLHNFTWFTGDGMSPEQGLIIDGQGNLYGTTYMGGNSEDSTACPNGCGTVFEIATNGAETILYNFTGLDGMNPGGNGPGAGTGTLVMDANTNLYGTTYFGGDSGNGTVFEIAPNGAETVLYSFQNNGTDGYNPLSGLSLDAQGNLYGAAYSGGALGGFGTIFKITPNGAESLLYSFTLTELASGIVMDQSQNLYGVSSINGVFELSSSGILTFLPYWSAQSDGNVPKGPLLLDPQGNLYGVDSAGGTTNGGFVYQISPATPNTVTATPTFSVQPGTYSSPQTITISDATPGATIFYTFSGASCPLSNCSARYTGPITINSTTPLSAVAAAPGLNPSAVVAAIYTITPTQ